MAAALEGMLAPRPPVGRAVSDKRCGVPDASSSFWVARRENDVGCQVPGRAVAEELGPISWAIRHPLALPVLKVPSDGPSFSG